MKIDDIPWVNSAGYDTKKAYGFCHKCGAELIPKWAPRITYYEGGKPVYQVKMKCPNMKWWNFHTVRLFTSAYGYWNLDPIQLD